MKIICTYFIIISFIVSSCIQKSNNKLSSETNIPKLTKITSKKKMKKIQGGSYNSFFGKDSTKIIRVNPFLLDETPITLNEFLTFVKENPKWSRSNVIQLYADKDYLKNWKSDFQIPDNISPEAPVTYVSWFAAKAYAKSVGKRLPTIDEWEYVASADRFTPNATKKDEFTKFILKSYQTKNRNKLPVKQNNPNYYEIYDLYGVIWEWTGDFNSIMITGESRNDNTINNENLFCAGAAITSSDLKNYAAFIRYAMRGSVKGNYCIPNMGFRCARDL